MVFDYWFMFPISICIATIAMASGVGGATFFAPILLLFLGLPPEVAIGVGLMTEVFGFTSGVIAYLRRKLVDFQLAKSMLVFSMPMAILGVVAANYVNPNILKAILGMGLLAVAFSLLRAPKPVDDDVVDHQTPKEGEAGKTCIKSAQGETFCYPTASKAMTGIVASVGGFFMGMISTGLGELNSYYLLQRCKVPGKVAVATSVFAVAFTAMVAAVGHLIHFISVGGDTLTTVLNLVMFTAPGVVIGGQIGPFVASKISQHALEKALGSLFVLVAALVIGQLLFV